MRPFNLERALAGDPVITEKGLLVTQIHLFKDVVNQWPLVGVVGKSMEWWDLKGEHSVLNAGMNLFMAPAKRQEWVNIYNDKNFQCSYYLGKRTYESENEARNSTHHHPNYITTVLIREWEE
jgi:hypothetical protein